MYSLNNFYFLDIEYFQLSSYCISITPKQADDLVSLIIERKKRLNDVGCNLLKIGFLCEKYNTN